MDIQKLPEFFFCRYFVARKIQDPTFDIQLAAEETAQRLFELQADLRPTEAAVPKLQPESPDFLKGPRAAFSSFVRESPSSVESLSADMLEAARKVVPVALGEIEWGQVAAAFLKQLQPTGLVDPSASIYTKFLEQLEKDSEQAMSKGVKPPILVTRDVQSLTANDKVAAVFDTLFTKFLPKKQGGSNVSVVIEKTEYLLSNMQNALRRAPDSFLEFEVKELPEEEVRKELVETMGIFNDAEFEKVWDLVGGHMGHLNLLRPHAAHKWKNAGGGD
uniref:Uncharacterized protein n=1 Tax=Chromera velia CCMP2878 TaxID=1169474 RepID=A0A0G4GXG5_9ALVE|eukprot:Cvel_5371.t1-p1 / transcript=Cvel_5371.t1 / gene=Cvel_5371 / organism=Chromera_velia_CCMP2878 / gene_product=hypothetical protein / transcript_product=hypothetical protein / location=Cvel_scaffold249:72153-72974(-) / protein_length=274 / sequence_SO=supercontig / SO=protein_coding / is_pseudo=false